MNRNRVSGVIHSEDQILSVDLNLQLLNCPQKKEEVKLARPPDLDPRRKGTSLHPGDPRPQHMVKHGMPFQEIIIITLLLIPFLLVPQDPRQQIIITLHLKILIHLDLHQHQITSLILRISINLDRVMYLLIQSSPD